MHFISELRYNPKTSKEEKYYRIKESYRDATGRVRCKILLNVGFLSGLRPEDIRDIGRGLTYKSEHRDEQDLFGDPFSHYSETVRSHIEEYWNAMVENGSVDAVKVSIEVSKEKARRLVDTDTMKHTEARELGSEWLCLQAIRQLKIDTFLAREGWTERQINAALAHLIVRTVYASSEYKALRIMGDNSAVCRLVYGDEQKLPSVGATYDVAPLLYAIKDKLEKHLCSITDDLFNQRNRLLLFDLTNFYYESPKFSSTKAKYGRSKEKRNDCKLLVLALCINTDGFIRYSSILEGNTADPKSLPDMVENLIQNKNVPADELLIVMDAGIATEENLRLIREKGYNYLCVSRSHLKEYSLKPDSKTVTVHDCKNQEIKLTEINQDENGDYYLMVDSPAKMIKETSMIRRFQERFEAELQKIKDSLHKKGGVKKYERVVERVGRAMSKYPSISKHYKITYTASEKGQEKHMEDISWSCSTPLEVIKNPGKYFLRTNILELDEKTVWDYYNLIRDIECTNRQLKNDLNLRPIYHVKDDRSDAHIFFGLLAYWVVNTIRHQLKQKGCNHYWTEIVRIMSTQKLIKTEAYNAMGEKMEIVRSSEPIKAAEEIYNMLKYKKKPPIMERKICSTQ